MGTEQSHKCQWLVIMAAVLSGHPKDALNSTVLRSSRNAFGDETVMALDGREFQLCQENFFGQNVDY